MVTGDSNASQSSNEGFRRRAALLIETTDLYINTDRDTRVNQNAALFSYTYVYLFRCLLADLLFKVLKLSLWLIGTVRAEPETVISRAWVQSPDPAA